MSDETQLMAVPHSKLKMDDPRTGISPAQVIIWKATHPETRYADIPTAQEVEDHVINANPESEHEENDTDVNIIPVTEEQRLKHLLASFAKLIWEYFCAAQ